SGDGDTGKSFLIETIKYWIRIHLKKVIAFPRVFNINDLTIYRSSFQLPVTHEFTDVLMNVIFINLRLCEIFDTDTNDDFFGRKHILLFGDLLPVLSPVKEQSPFVKMSINMRQRCDNDQLPLIDTIYLLPTCYLCKILNTAMFDKIDGDEIVLIAENDIDCVPAMEKRVHKILEDKDDIVSEIADIERVTTIQIGVKVMIRQNIDVTMGLVNGTIGNVIVINCSLDGNPIDSIKIVISDNKEITITKVDIKFEVFHKMVIHRKQFPLSLNYGITIHKSQGKANSEAIVKYNRDLCSKLLQINSSEKKVMKIHDCRWTISNIMMYKIGLCNDDHVSCYTNAITRIEHVTSCSNIKCNYNVTTLEKSCLINGNCNECKNTFLKKKTVIELTLFVLVIQLNLYTFLNGPSKKIIDNRINSVPTSTVILTINKKKYKVITSIFYEGEEINHGHYTCMLRADKMPEWCYSNDLQVSKKKWPKGAQGAYMLFFEQSTLSKFGNNFYI
ncbi:PIF1 helicase, partial [Acromyrmex insinuator]